MHGACSNVAERFGSGFGRRIGCARVGRVASAGWRAHHGVAVAQIDTKQDAPSDAAGEAPFPNIPFVGLGLAASDHKMFMEKTQSYLGIFDKVNARDGNVFAADSMLLFGRNAGFLRDRRFIDAVMASRPDEIELTIIWRTHVLCWAARQGAALAGDFVECGTYRGYSASVVAKYVGLEQTGKNFFLYDLFDPTGATGEGHRMPEHGPELHAKVTARFAEYATVRVIKGRVPDSFAQACPQAIAFLHIDMNSADAEIAALDHLFDRVVPGGIVVFDDYGYRCYAAQHDAEDAFAKARGYQIVELPTGQGLLVKR